MLSLFESPFFVYLRSTPDCIDPIIKGQSWVLPFITNTNGKNELWPSYTITYLLGCHGNQRWHKKAYFFTFGQLSELGTNRVVITKQFKATWWQKIFVLRRVNRNGWISDLALRPSYSCACMWLKLEHAFSMRSSPVLRYSFPAQNTLAFSV